MFLKRNGHLSIPELTEKTGAEEPACTEVDGGARFQRDGSSEFILTQFQVVRCCFSQTIAMMKKPRKRL